MTTEPSNPDGIGDRLPDPFVRSRKPEPDAVPPAATTLSGLLGDSDRPGRRRLYLTTRLDYYVEFSTADVIGVEDVAPDEPPFPGLDATRVSLRADARIDYVSNRLAGAADEFELDVRGSAARPRSRLGNAGRAAGTVVFCDPQIRRTAGGSCVGTCDTQFFGTCEESTCHGTCFEATCLDTCGGGTCRGTCGEATCGRATCLGTCGDATCGGDTCFGTCGEATCFGTCGEATCDGATCQGTCEGVTCAGTCGELTCGGTCDATCGRACGDTGLFVCQPTLPAERCFLSQQC